VCVICLGEYALLGAGALCFGFRRGPSRLWRFRLGLLGMEERGCWGLRVHELCAISYLTRTHRPASIQCNLHPWKILERIRFAETTLLQVEPF